MASLQPPNSPLEQRLIDHIGRYGPITFEAFMEAALYDDEHGYYTSRRRQAGSTPAGPVGTDGDYFTSPVTHPAFGALIALQLEEMWKRLGSPSEFVVVEMGAGDGVLASDITDYVTRELPDFSRAMRYVATDLVPPSGASMVSKTDELPTGATGCVISNELLDALPVNRFIVHGGAVREIYVDFQDGEFVESIGEVADPEVEARVAPFLRSLPEAYRGEVNLRLGYWSDSVSATLDRGYAITIDYGYDRPDLYAPTRVDGSLRCYYQHTLGQNPLWRIGRQDITAHVDFTAVDHVLAVNDISKIGSVSQSEFLGNLGAEVFLNEISQRAASGELPRAESEEELAGIGALVNPDGLGSFRVAVHTKGVLGEGEKPGQLSGLGGVGESKGASLAAGRRSPGLDESSAAHARLLRGSNPFTQAQTPDVPTWEQLFGDEP